ncbi:PREDICTED: uncharacterized protein LOC104598005 [Nelumbo nucifera]|nr:PREDICTED: uncharacterized protein LOC104598005 [Nelumbo nucifera]
MENNGEAGDDQGSGWFQVKKKHKTSSKFSIQNLVGGFSSKTPSTSLHSQPSLNDRTGNSQARQKSESSKGGGDASLHVQVGGEYSFSASKEAEKTAHDLVKCTANQDSELPKPSYFRSISTTNSNNQEVIQKEKLDMIPKIKWGDLEDDALVLHHDITDRTEIKFGDIGVDNLAVCRKSVNANDSMSSVPSCTAAPPVDVEVVTSIDAEHVPCQTSTMIQRDKPLEHYKELNETSSKNVGSPKADEKILGPNDGVENIEEINHKHVMPTRGAAIDGLDSNDLYSQNSLSSANQEVGMVMTPKGAESKSNDDALNVSAVPVANGLPCIIVGTQDPVLLSEEKNVPETSDDALVREAVEGCSSKQDGAIDVDLSQAQIMTALGEGELGESRERFRQRLWCFLFENLNRAVDELYLLCELECDLEQMKEAILVLEEATSDFKELKSRVEGFEKGSSPRLSIDGRPVNVKSEHRRPHALSWEVRRMTTSPHRAEILSSSLEAFKKIQQERARMASVHDTKTPGPGCLNACHVSSDHPNKTSGRNDVIPSSKESVMKSRKQIGVPDFSHGNLCGEKQNIETGRLNKEYLEQNSHTLLQNLSVSDPNSSQVTLKETPVSSVAGKSRKEHTAPVSEMEKLVPKKDKLLTESKVEKNPKSMDSLKKQALLSEKEKDKRNVASWKCMDAWKEKRNWEDILATPLRSSSRVSHSPGMSRKSMDRARILHDKLMSPEKKKKTALDLKKEAEEKHARAMKIRSELENERVQRLQRTSEKLNRVNEWQAVRNMKLREGMYARQQRSESRHEAYLAQVVRRAGDESSKVNEVRFITSLNEENKKLMLRQKLHDSELRRAEKLQVMKIKQKEDMAREEAVLERRKLLEAEKLQRLAETQRKKEEAQVRREEERKASSAAREAKAVEQLRRKEVRAKAQQEEAELLAQKLAERLSESEQRRKFYLEQIRERASMDFRDQSSPLLRRSSNKEGQGRSMSNSNSEDHQANNTSSLGVSALQSDNAALQHPLKRRIKKIRQRLMALKYEFIEPPAGSECTGIGNRALVGTARAKLGRWLQELQRLRQARKGAASIGLIVGDMIKFLDGKDSELHVSRQAGLLDFIASALPASHISRPEACQVTTYLLRLLRVVLVLPANRSYFLAQNLLPPIIPMLSAALENYIKIAAALNVTGSANSLSNKMSTDNFESISEVLEGFLWTATAIIGYIASDERQLQMQDGLVELVVAYQIIHRLRDLFALYDRPQVEGSPFPSSILLSLNLLAVLTSRTRTISSINWDSFPSKMTPVDESLEAKPAPSADPMGSTESIANGDSGLIPSLVNTHAETHLLEVHEDRPLDVSCSTSRQDESSSGVRDFSTEMTDIPVEMNNVHFASKVHVTNIPAVSRKGLIEGQANSPPKDEKSLVDNGTEHKNEDIQGSKQLVALLLSVISETGLVSLPSLLTAVLLQANSRLSSEQASYVLPSNFEEVATGVLKVLNNLALLDITFMQRMLARPDLKMEFFHLMSFLLSHCTSKWKTATDQLGLLLLESLLLLGYFALFHPENQAVLRWGKSPTILHKVCDLPFVFFSDPELMPILASTLVAACYGCEQNKGVVQQELSTEMLLSLIRSCRTGSANQSDPSPTDYPTTEDPCETNQLGSDSKKLQGEFSLRSSRYNPRSTRVPLGRNGSLGSTRISKVRNQRDGKATIKTCEEWALKHNMPASEAASTFMLHSRLPSSFIDKAEAFFSVDLPKCVW